MASEVVNGSFKGFDFSSDKVLCLYDEFNCEKGISDLEKGKDFGEEFQRSRMTRCSPGAVYNQSDDSPYQDIFSLVEKCMKRNTDDIMRVLEGISSRLSNLELYCYNIDKSVGEMSINSGRDYEETDARLKSLDKHLEEVSQSVQVLRDRKELTESQKILPNLQLAQTALSSPKTPLYNVERSISPASDHYKTDDTYEVQNQQFAIVLHQVAPQQQPTLVRPVEVRQPVAPSSQVAHQHTGQNQHYYLTSAPYQVQVQASQGQYLTPDTQYHIPQPQQSDINRVQFQQVPTQVNQAPPQLHHFVQYQQQPQQPQQMIPTQVSFQQPPMPATSWPQSSFCYPPYRPSQSFQQAPRETVSSSINMHTPFSSSPQQVMTSGNGILNGYSGGPVQLQPSPQKNFVAPNAEIYNSLGPHHSLSPATEYMIYGNEEVKRQPPSQCQFPQSSSHSPAPFLHQLPQHVSIIQNPNMTQFNSNQAHNELNPQSTVHRGWTG